MSAREPQEMAQVAVQTGAKKTHRTWDRVLVSAFLAGAYIAFGGLVAITVSSGLKPATWGTLPTLFTGTAFTLGLVLVLIAGSDLATGNMMLVPLSAMRGKIGLGDVARNLTLVLVGNLARRAVRRVLPRRADRVIGYAGAAAAAGADPRPARRDRRGQGDGAHGLADVPARGRLQLAGLPGGVDVAGREVRLGQDPRDLLPDHGVRRDGLRPRRGQHVLPAGRHLRRRPGPRLGRRRCCNWVLAGLGNLVGAVVFVATSYWYLFLKDQPDQPAVTEPEPAERA